MKTCNANLNLKNGGFSFDTNEKEQQNNISNIENNNLKDSLTRDQFEEKEFKYNYLYKITNLENGKIYIGIHSTNNLNDGYMGSSKILKQSIRKRGRDNFKKEILEYFPDRESLREAEFQIVNEEFVAREDTYNLSVGGYGGESYESYMSKKSKEFKEACQNACLGKIWITDGISINKRINPEDPIPEGFYKGKTSFRVYSIDKNGQLQVRENAYLKDPEYLRSIGKNGMWVTNGKEDKRILEGEEIPEGYQPGRKPSSNSNKNRRWLFNPSTLSFKMVYSEEVDNLLNEGWVLKAPANTSTGSDFANRRLSKVQDASNELLRKIKDAGIDIENPNISQRKKIRMIVDAGLVPKSSAFNKLTNLLPQFFKKSNMTWITNGIENTKIDKTEPLPEGWRYGTTIKRGPNKNN